VDAFCIAVVHEHQENNNGVSSANISIHAGVSQWSSTTQPASCSVTSVSGSVSRTTPPPNQVSAGIRAKGGGMVFGSVIALFAAVFWVL